jgi:hypothetical protein
MILLLSLSGLDAPAQSVKPSFFGTKTPYQPRQKKYTAPPAGYVPVFINYVGRHGARFMTKPGGDADVLNLLLMARGKNALTDTGKILLRSAQAFMKIEKGNYENITLSGAAEQQGIGARLYETYRPVFRGNGMDVMTTAKIRTQQSAKAFLQGIKNDPAEQIHWYKGDSLDDILRFYDISPAYQQYKKSAALQQRLDSFENDERLKKIAGFIAARVFSSSFAGQLSSGISLPDKNGGKEMNTVSFIKDLYDLYAVQQDIQGEIAQARIPKEAIRFGVVFRERDLVFLNLINNASDFFEKGPAADAQGIQVTIAAPLLLDFLNTINHKIENPASPDLKLRFSHAETISPFATLLGIPEASVSSNSIYTYNKKWKAADIIPMSANIQWILYSNGKDYLVKTLLNEKEVALPVQTSNFPYYSWSQVKDYYLQKLASLHAGPEQDMHQYLLEVSAGPVPRP